MQAPLPHRYPTVHAQCPHRAEPRPEQERPANALTPPAMADASCTVAHPLAPPPRQARSRPVSTAGSAARKVRFCQVPCPRKRQPAPKRYQCSQPRNQRFSKAQIVKFCQVLSAPARQPFGAAIVGTSAPQSRAWPGTPSPTRERFACAQQRKRSMTGFCSAKSPPVLKWIHGYCEVSRHT